MTPVAFLLYHDNKTFIDRLSDDQAGKLFKAIYNYEVERLDAQDLDELTGMVFTFFKIALDRGRSEYEEKCKARADAGRKGGLAKASNAKKIVANVPKSKSNIKNKKESNQWV